ncbi:putative entry exclusion protein TrbK-alt [Chelativorans salis]|uniref:Entry exclusion protein TrbK-alt n=1 Tax=Chelativorans salis TaxID=2978478 RepID=A0ABT2LP22_9HYPH|nr:putative entry exclusion protein TrbK-alt [Chelativorans sp. EGI FJ00035]MCT7376316.1 putative entry exclusion protein TrbK-alt [Chelativorans sp. EGI FJ00035]
MEGKNLARIGAIVFVAFAITATVIEMTREDEPVRQAPARALAPSVDPLRAEQRRCQQMGEVAARDPECLAVWAETRDRFLGRSPSDSVQRDSEDQ